MRRHPAARPDAAGRARAQDDHARRRGDRPRHRGDLGLARPAARVGDRDGAAHRRRARRHRHPGQRAQRPVLRLPELLRHARLHARPHDRADAGQAVRPRAALRLQRPEELHGRRSPRSRATAATRAQGRLPRRGGVQHRRAVPDGRRVQRQGPVGQRLHRPADLLPVAAARPRGLPHGQGLHLALGHRLVLVRGRVRPEEQDGPPPVAAPVPALGRLPQARRARPEVRPDRGDVREAALAAAGVRHPGRGDPGRARCTSSSRSSPRR